MEGYSGQGFRPANGDLYWLWRIRLDVTLRPTKWLTLFAQTQDARAFGRGNATPPLENTWDLYLGYADIGDYEKGRYALRVGRQQINIGDQRLVGSSNWANASRSFDAVRGMVHFGGAKVDVFAASVVNTVNDAWDHHQQGNNLHGVHAEITKWIPGATLEPYVLWRLQPRLRNEAGVVANLDMKVPGFRLSGKLPQNFDYQMDLVGQYGSLGSDDVSAWAGHWGVGRTWAKTALTPRPWFEFNYATGDGDSRDGKRNTFDQLYPTPHDKYGLADQVGWRNIKDYRAGLDLHPRKNLTTTLEYNNWFLANRFDALYTAPGAVVARSTTGTAGTHVGQELDIVATWAITKPLQAGGGYGHLFPGEFLQITTPGRAYNYWYLTFTYKF